MQFKVYSLKNAKKILNSGNWISIREPGYKEYYKDIDKIASKNILKLYFDDVDPWRTENGLIVDFHKSEFLNRQPVFFDSKMAKDSIDFCHSCFSQSLNPEINIHCAAGYSRSQALAYCLNVYFNLYVKHDPEEFRKNITENNCMNAEVIRVFTTTIFK